MNVEELMAQGPSPLIFSSFNSQASTMPNVLWGEREGAGNIHPR